MNVLIIKLSDRIAQREGAITNNNVTSSIRCFIDDISILYRVRKPEQYEDAELDGRVFEDDGTLRSYLETITTFCKEYGLSINNSKTQAISFDYSDRELHFFPGGITFPSGDIIEVGESLTLLGLPLDRNLTFKSYTKERRRKGMFALWKLRRLQASGVSADDMKKSYSAYIRSILEYGLMPCYKMLTDNQKQEIEAVQRRATKTLLGIRKLYGDDVPSYEERLRKLGLEYFDTRMQNRLEKDVFVSNCTANLAYNPCSA